MTILNNHAHVITNYHWQSDMGQLHHKCNWLRLLATHSISITNKQNHIVHWK